MEIRLHQVAWIYNIRERNSGEAKKKTGHGRSVRLWENQGERQWD